VEGTGTTISVRLPAGRAMAQDTKAQDTGRKAA
jgi:hypothetical protein